MNNLVSNAIKFTEVGSVKVEVKTIGQSVRICVADTGIGIAPEHQHRLFEEFFQIQNHERDRLKGFGLGLAICDRLIGQLGGKLEVHSVVGHGSRFTVLVPLTIANDSAVATSADPEPNLGQIIQAGALG